MKLGEFQDIKKSIEETTIENVAHALSNICRFAGKCKKFYSVAEHSLNVSKFVSDNAKLYAMTHDMTEMFTSDIPGPLKQIIPQIKQYELVLEKLMLNHFNIIITNSIKEEVKIADKLLHKIESNKLMDNNFLVFNPNIVKIKCYTPKKAKKLFLKEYNKLIKR